MVKLVRSPDRSRLGSNIRIFYFVIFWLGLSLSAHSAPISVSIAADSTSPPTANIDTVHFTVYDFAKGTLSGTQQLPIDRAFTLKVINIPDSVHITSLIVHEVDSRVYKDQVIKFRHPLYSNLPVDTASLLDHRILKCSDPASTSNKGELNFVVPNLLPNWTYYFDFRHPNDSRPLTAQEKNTLKTYLNRTLKNDPVVTGLFNNRMQYLYSDTNALYSSALPTIDSLNAHFKQLIHAKYPNYVLTSNVLDLDLMQGFSNAIDGIRAVHYNFAKYDVVKPKDSLTFKNLTTAKNIFTPDFNWFGLHDSTRRKTVDTTISRLLVRTDSASLKVIENSLQKISQFLDTTINKYLPDTITNATRSTGGLLLSYYLDIAKNAQRNVTIDLGLGYSPSMSNLFAYTMINIYFRPIDKNLPLLNTGARPWDFIGSRLSLAAGLTLTPVDKPGTRAGIVGNKGVLLGAGFRLLSWFKITGGTLMYHGLNQNPLISSNPTLRWTPFVSLSIDVDVKTLFTSFPVFNDLLFK